MARMHAAWGDPRSWARSLAVAAVFGAFLGVIGPFGSYFNGPLGERLAYWVGMFCAGALLLGSAERWAVYLGARCSLPAWFSLGVAVVLAAIPMTLLSRSVAVAQWPFLARLSGVEWYFQVLVLSLPLTAASAFLNRTSMPPPAEPIEVSRNGAFLSRLPPALGPDLLCLQMEDHYVRVHTRLGSDLILVRLSDAVAELSAIEGLQVHRSWWVARAAVEAVRWQGRNLRLRLVNGLEVPVARNAVSSVRAAGWLG